MAGGAPITISGTMLAMHANLNSILCSPSWLTGVEIYGPPLTCKHLPLIFCRERRV